MNNKNRIKALWTAFSRAGVQVYSSREDLRKTQLLNGMSLVGVSFCIFFIILSLHQGLWGHSIALITAATCVLANLIFLAIYRRYRLSAIVQVSIMGALLLHFLITGGDDNSAIFWYYIFAPLTLFLLGIRLGSAITLFFLGGSAAIMLMPDLGILQTAYPQAVKVRFLASNLAVYFLILLYEMSRTEALSSLREMSSKYEALASTDPLTELLNRRGMQSILQSQFEICRRNKKAFSVLIADVDFFKNFNDLHGHECGDIVLKHVSKIIRQTLRQQDSVARWGGEEFLLMLPETPVAGAANVAEKVRQTIEATQIEFEGNSLQIRISVGGAVFSPQLTLMQLISAADKNLYQAKAEGRNRSLVSQAGASSRQAPLPAV